MFQDFKDLLSSLNASRVKYLIIGGYAVAFHAQPRTTKDLDILVKPDAANAAALLRALKAFGAPVSTIKAADLIEDRKFFRFGAPPVMVDILSSISGIEFDAAWKRRVKMTIDAERKLKANVISREDLIVAKLAAGRPQDLADVDAVRKATKATESSHKPRRSRTKT